MRNCHILPKILRKNTTAKTRSSPVKHKNQPSQREECKKIEKILKKLKNFRNFEDIMYEGILKNLKKTQSSLQILLPKIVEFEK